MTEIKPHLKIEKLEKTIQDLREREIRLRASVNAHTDLCLIIDKDGHISDIVSNQGQLLPEENRSLIGQSLQNILPNVGGTDFLHELSLVVEGRKSHQFVYEHDNQQFIARLTPLEESHDSTKLVIMSIVLSSDQRRNMHQGVSEVLSEKLLVSQQLAFELLESIGEAFYGLDRDWCFIYLNRKAEQLWGRNRDELIGKNIWEEFPQGVDTQAYREMHRAIEEQCAVSFETYSSFLDAWVEVEVYPTMSGLSVYFHDRTRRKTAEVALQASEEKYRQIVETAQEGIWIIDAENRTSFVNPKMAEMLGYSIEEMLGTSIFDYMDEEGQAITARSIETGGLKTKGLHEFSFTKKDGSRLYGLLSKTPLFDDVGTYVGALAMLVDIGDRKQTSDAQAQLAAIVNSSGDAIISMTLGGIVTSWNSSAEEIYGYSTEEMIGKSINILIPPEGWEGEAALLIRAASGEIVQNLEASRLRKNGTEIFISITVSPMRDSYNNIIGVSKIARDITEQKLKEVQLRESEAALKQAQRVARIGSWTWHVQTDRLEWSDEMYHIFGIDKETFSGELSEVISHAIHPNDRAAVERANASVIKTGASAPLEYRVIWEDGTIRDVWAEAGNMILDSAGKPTILTGIVQDITERKRAEKSLRESEERYRTLFETMKQGIVYQDETGAITAANLAAQAVLGLTLDQLQGITSIDPRWRAIREDGSEFPGETHPAMVALKTGKSIHDVVMGVYNPKIDEHRWIIVNATPQFHSGEAFPYQVYTTFDDITERRHILHQLQERERTLSLSLHAAEAGVWSWDIEDKRIVWDEQMESIHGLEPGSFGGNYEAWRKSVHPEDMNSAEQAIQDALSDINPFNIEFRIVRTDGMIRHVLGQATVVRNEDKQPLKMIGVNIDITERKQAEEEVRKLNTELERRVIERTRELVLINQELEAFNYSVSHDLRTPLRALDGFSQAVLEDYGDKIDEEGKRYLERIRLASQRMSRLIDDLLNLSRISRQEIKRADLNLSEISREITSELETNDSNRSVQFVIQQGIHVQGDKNLLQIVMQNLLGNAWKFTSKREVAHIEFGETQQDGQSVLFVRDNGAGFDMAYVDKLFGAFQRLHSVTEFEGTGIGLATVQRIIHRHGGKVWTESTLNEGATFYFTLSD